MSGLIIYCKSNHPGSLMGSMAEIGTHTFKICNWNGIERVTVEGTYVDPIESRKIIEAELEKVIEAGDFPGSVSVGEAALHWVSFVADGRKSEGDSSGVRSVPILTKEDAENALRLLKHFNATQSAQAT